jgi:DNA mismatch repair protein MutL
MSLPRIAVLDRTVVNQIAAGEVVDRPASAVKELVENSLDAGARRIDVDIEGGGLRVIRVVDDGGGMSPEEMEISLERHATSKLRVADDLLSMQTMGFRGEALPSIGAVSRLEMRSRVPEVDAGFRIVVEAGVVVERSPDGCRTGTQVTVGDLFFNTPARLKFLKSLATEAAHVAEVVASAALAAPETHFTLTLDGRRSLDLPPCPSRAERTRAVLGRRGNGLRVGQLREDGLHVEACLGSPEQTGRTAQSVSLVVNRRSVRDRALLHAVSAGYGELVAHGRYPLAVVHVDLDPSTIDVNVHPQKTEVRFADPSRVYSALKRCVRDALARARWDDDPAAARPYTVAAPQRRAAGYEEQKQRLLEATRRFWSAQTTGVVPGREAAEAPASYEAGPPSGVSSPAAEDGTPVAGACFRGLRVLGQVMGTYLVCEGPEELVLLDQHAAHERVTFERLRQAVLRGAIPSQRLLIPVTVTLEAGLEAAAHDAAESLRHLGFEADHFGGTTWTVRAVPELLRASDAAALFRDVLEELADHGESDVVAAAQDGVISRLACHSSVRAGQWLEESEIRALLLSLDEVDFATRCPHGRPVVVRLSRAELEGRFGRK